MSTQRYSVIITMNPSHSAQVIVEAESVSEANDKALAMAHDNHPFALNFELDEDSVHGAEIYLPDPDSTEPYQPQADDADQTDTNAETFYFCSVTEVNGEHEYISRFLVRCNAGEAIGARLTEILHDFRGEPEPDDLSDTWVQFTDGTAAKNPSYRAITEPEFEIMSMYLSVL